MNLMIRDGEPYFIDFQGGRRGPVYYDVASFIWQARSRYPEDLKNGLVQTYIEAAREFIPDLDEDAFRERLRLFVLFRTLQVLGAYGFRGYFEKKPHFIASVPFAIDNLRRLLKTPFVRYPYLTEVLTSLTEMQQFYVNAEDRRLEVKIYRPAPGGHQAPPGRRGDSYPPGFRLRPRGCSRQTLYREEVHQSSGLLRLHRRTAPLRVLRRTSRFPSRQQVRHKGDAHPQRAEH